MKRPMIQVILGGSLALLVFGCGQHYVMTKKACQMTDWRAKGYQDGLHGEKQNNLSQAIDACWKYHIEVDKAAYTAGWQKGIRQYCSAHQGYQIGQSGRQCPSCCPADLRPRFEYAWKEGITAFCTPERLYQRGKMGKAYVHHCPRESYDRLHSEYERGKKVYQKRVHLQNQIKQINQQLNTTEQEKRAFEEAENYKEALNMTKKIERLKRERRALESHLRTLDAAY